MDGQTTYYSNIELGVA